MSPSRRVWRLLVDGAAPGSWNMGVDEALLDSVVAGGEPALRLYRWDGSWLSLGYGQGVAAQRRAACAAAGVGIVRRVTGGRAVLHGGDLTYAVAAPEALLPPGLRPTYELISAAVRAALCEIGIDAVPAPARPRAPTADADRDFDCFAEAAGDELCVGGRKLVGSAQRRARGGVLQHGSIRIRPDPPAASAAAGAVAGAATSFCELGFGEPFVALEEACARSFAAALGARFERGGLSPAERRRAGARSEDPAPPRFASL